MAWQVLRSIEADLLTWQNTWPRATGILLAGASCYSKEISALMLRSCVGPGLVSVFEPAIILPCH